MLFSFCYSYLVIFHFLFNINNVPFVEYDWLEFKPIFIFIRTREKKKFFFWEEKDAWDSVSKFFPVTSTPITFEDKNTLPDVKLRWVGGGGMRGFS